MEKVSVVEEKIKRLKKTISEKASGSKDPSGGGELRVFRKNLKRLQRRRRVLLTAHTKDRTAKTQEEKIKAKAAPAGKEAPGESPVTEQQAKPSAEKPAVKEKPSGDKPAEKATKGKKVESKDDTPKGKAAPVGEKTSGTEQQAKPSAEKRAVKEKASAAKPAEKAPEVKKAEPPSS